MLIFAKIDWDLAYFFVKMIVLVMGHVVGLDNPYFQTAVASFCCDRI